MTDIYRDANIRQQPTNDELSRAFGEALDCEGIGGARAESRQRLRALRDARTTWFDSDELRLRASIDAYLRGEQAPGGDGDA